MLVYKFSGQDKKLPLGTKIMLTVSVIVALSLLFFFAFTFFLISMAVGAVVYLVNLFQGRRPPKVDQHMSPPHPRAYYSRRDRKDDDDVIDI